MWIKEVCHNLFVSDYENAERYGPAFELTLNCSEELLNVSRSCLRIPVRESDEDIEEKLYKYWNRYIHLVDECIRKEGRVLMYCSCEESMSTSTAVAYLIYKTPYKVISVCVDQVRKRTCSLDVSKEHVYMGVWERYQGKCRVGRRTNIDC